VASPNRWKTPPPVRPTVWGMSAGGEQHRCSWASLRRVPLVVALPVSAVLIATAGVAVLVVGSRLFAGESDSVTRHVDDDGLLDSTAKFLLAIAIVMVATHGLGRLVRRIGQPPVVGEVAAGVVLGPTLLASASPQLYQYLFPPPVLSALSMAAQLGLVVFMFLVGWETDLHGLRRNSRAIITVSYSSLAIPFLSGLVLALALYDTYGTAQVGFTPFALFVGLALGITAMPVLARILNDTGLLRTPVGGLAIATAAVEDAVAWTLLAVTLAFANVTTDLPSWLVLVLALAFCAAMLTAVRPALSQVLLRAERRRATELTLLTWALVGAFGSAVATHAIGIHAIFGAFLFGLIMPRGTLATEVVTTRINGFTMAVLLPLFFAAVGMQTSLGSLGGDPNGWVLLAMIFVVAVLSKLFGAGLGALVAGLSRGDAYTIGVLKNCRGLTEIVVASVGLQLGIIDQRLFTTLVLVALGTTALTTPLLRLRYRNGLPTTPTGTTDAEPVLRERVATGATRTSNGS
jgi:Kef-type K+ transport system membrane component KefB